MVMPCTAAILFLFAKKKYKNNFCAALSAIECCDIEKKTNSEQKISHWRCPHAEFAIEWMQKFEPNTHSTKVKIDVGEKRSDKLNVKVDGI